MFKRMPSSKKFLITLPAIALLNVSILGCAEKVYFSQEKGFKKGDDCLYCHATGGIKGVRDFSPIYNNPRSHHPVGMEYPLGAMSRPDFNQPNGYMDDTIFFDDDGFGQLDADDVRLFGTGNAVTVECGSCHKEHGGSQDSDKVQTDYYLRFANDGSKLCSVCHRQ